MEKSEPPPIREYGRKRQETLRWFLAGCLVGGFLMWTQASAVGGWTGLLAVGEDSLLRATIAEELPDLALVPDEGNDGQIYYAMALDLAGDRVPRLINDPELRYQRIVYPLVASLGGVLRGYPLFWSMVAISILGLGLTSAGIEILRSDRGLPTWVHIGALLNPGIWLSVRQLTPDMIGLGICLMALAWASQHRWPLAVGGFVVGALTKESLVLMAGGMATWLLVRRRLGLALLIGGAPVVAVLAWSRGAQALSGGLGRIGGGNWSPPFRGIVEASAFWPTTPPRERIMTAVAFGIVALGIAAFILTRSTYARCLLLPWLVLPVITSEWVWRFGNGSLRGFAPIGVLAGYALALRKGPDSVGAKSDLISALPD